MENKRLEILGVVQTTSRYAGALVGAATAAGKRIELHVRKLVTAQSGPPQAPAEKAEQVPEQKRKPQTGRRKKPAAQVQTEPEPAKAPEADPPPESCDPPASAGTDDATDRQEA